MRRVEEIQKDALKALGGISDTGALEEVRIRYLGRKGELTKILRSLKDVPLAERRRVGAAANALRSELVSLLAEREASLAPSAGGAGAELDVTRPGVKLHRGHLHLLTKVDKEIRDIFRSMSFSVVEGPEVETSYYNFDALNIPQNHPARDVWDTFWIKSNPKSKISKFRTPALAQLWAGRQNSKIKEGEKLLLRTHTSPVQVRYMETHEPPFQIIVPGRCFRYEAIDASHEFNFYQLEGLMVGGDVSLANFKFVVEEFFRKFFGKGISFRFRPSYFPFVEPGLEVDIKLNQKSAPTPGGRGSGQSVGELKAQSSGWLEVMGAGMVHRNVFDAVRYNPDAVQGFAFGMGIDRLAMIKYKVPDIRLFYGGDLRFVRQF